LTGRFDVPAQVGSESSRQAKPKEKFEVKAPLWNPDFES